VAASWIVAAQPILPGFRQTGEGAFPTKKKDIAWDEANHAAQFAELNGLVSASTKENMKRMLKGERPADKGKREAALRAKKCNCAPAHDLFDESVRDEGRHARALEGLLKRANLVPDVPDTAFQRSAGILSGWYQ
jgi:rubrerythrin